MDQIFTDSDAAYAAWIAEHPEGLVVNLPRGNPSNDAKLHRAACYTIQPPAAPDRSSTEGAYIKICATSVEAARSLLRQHLSRTDADFSGVCRICMP